MTFPDLVEHTRQSKRLGLRPAAKAVLEGFAKIVSRRGRLYVVDELDGCQAIEADTLLDEVASRPCYDLNDEEGEASRNRAASGPNAVLAWMGKRIEQATDQAEFAAGLLARIAVDEIAARALFGFNRSGAVRQLTHGDVPDEWAAARGLWLKAGEVDADALCRCARLVPVVMRRDACDLGRAINMVVDTLQLAAEAGDVFMLRDGYAQAWTPKELPSPAKMWKPGQPVPPGYRTGNFFIPPSDAINENEWRRPGIKWKGPGAEPVRFETLADQLEQLRDAWHQLAAMGNLDAAGADRRPPWSSFIAVRWEAAARGGLLDVAPPTSSVASPILAPVVDLSAVVKHSHGPIDADADDAEADEGALPEAGERVQAVARLKQLDGTKGARKKVAAEFGVNVRTIGKWIEAVELEAERQRKAGAIAAQFNGLATAATARPGAKGR